MFTLIKSNDQDKLRVGIYYLLLGVAFFVPLFPIFGTLFIIVALVLASIDIQRRKAYVLTKAPAYYYILGFMFLSLLSLVNSPVLAFSAYFWGYNIFIYICIYFLTMIYIDTYEKRKSLLLVMIFAALCSCIFGLYQFSNMYGVGAQEWVDPSEFPLLKRRLYSTLENPNLMGAYLLEIVALVGPIAIMYKRIKYSWIAWILALFFLLCIVLTYSRGIWISMAVMILYWGIVLDRRVLVSLLAIPIILYFYHGGIADRLWSLINSQDTSVTLRYALWDSTIYMIKDHPFLGIGWGAYWAVYPTYNYFIQDPETIIYHAHNMFIHLAAVIGIPGLFCFLAILGIHGWKAFMLTNELQTGELVIKYGLTALLIGICISGMTDYELYSHQVSIVFWQILGLGASVMIREGKKELSK